MARSTRRPPAPDPRQELDQLVADLDLTTLPEALPNILALAERDHLSYSEFALRMFRTEMETRRVRSLERILHRAHLGAVEGLHGFDFTIRPNLEERIVKELITCRFVEEHRNVICVGKSGLGKTRIAKAISKAACLAGYDTTCIVTAEMLERIHAAQADGTLKRTFDRFVKPAVLLLEEFANEPFDNEATKYLFRLVAARHKQGSIIITANSGFSGWKKLFPNEATAVATVDRLIDGATILRFTGKSSREPKEVTGAPLEE
jgi:DNA replication protein DnaC